MKIIKRNELPIEIKRITCKKCGSIFEFTKDECKATSQLGVMHDGLGSYNINCPVCNKINYFDW